MSESPHRRRGHRPAGARARQVPAEAHEGPPAAFLSRHGQEARDAARDPKLWRALLPRLLARVADPRNLMLAVGHVAESGDRWLRGLDPDERWQLSRVLGGAVSDGKYRPGRGRRREETKASGTGTRTLTVPDSADRVVERAVVQVLQPLLDPLFLDTSLGYRPGRGRTDALVLAERLARDGDRWAWIAEDYSTAFDRVPQRRLLDVVGHYLPEDGIVRLVETLVVTKAGKGLKQGGPLSPLMLNTYLHHLLDRPWRDRPPDAPLIRVADDVLVLCRTEAEASDAYAALKQLAADSGMSLKGTPGSSIRNLAAGQPVVWLGYGLLTDGARLQVRLTDRLWRSLERRIRECHTKLDPPVRAAEVIRGWVDQLGPTLPSEDARQVYARVTRVAAEHGFEEVPGHEELLERWSVAHERWEGRRTGADPATRMARGSARAAVVRAESGPSPGGPPERGAPPGATSDVGFLLSPSGSCAADDGPGTWAFFLTTEGGGVVSSRRGSSPRTTQERIELVAVLRGLEAVPDGARVRLLLADGATAAGVAALCQSPGEPAPAGLTGRAADLWRRLATALARLRPVVSRHDPSPGSGPDGPAEERPYRPPPSTDA